ncbi:MAG: hypothetical protein AAGK97_13155 [Bacteroidota bacterium]
MKEELKQSILQIADILDKIDAASYKKPLKIFTGSSLGQHFRHILDFYNCVIKASELGFLDYACRERNPRIETDVNYAKNTFIQINNLLDKLDFNKEIEVLADVSVSKSVERPVLKSTIGREVLFAFDHAVHHLAMIKMGIKTNFPEIELEDQVGVAPSTLKFQSANYSTDK